VLFILAVLVSVPLAAQAESPALQLVAGPDAVKWGPVPPSFPKGAMIAVLAGNPFKEGPYVVRLKNASELSASGTSSSDDRKRYGYFRQLSRGHGRQPRRG
jgi:hypothetical protein